MQPRLIAVPATTALLAASLVTPAVASGHGTGSASITVDRRCSARLVGPGRRKTARKVSAPGAVVSGLKPGVYKLVASPKKCDPEPAKLRVKTGKRAAGQVEYDSRLPAAEYRGTFSGSVYNEPTNTTFAWSGQLTLRLRQVGRSSVNGFAEEVIYDVTAASGTWTFSGEDSFSCTHSGNGTFDVSDVRPDMSQFLTNPWNNNVYAADVVGNLRRVPYTRTCGSSVTEGTRELPFYLLRTNPWGFDGPTAPLPTGATLAGNYTWDRPDSSGRNVWNWTWNLEPSFVESTSYSRP